MHSGWYHHEVAPLIHGILIMYKIFIHVYVLMGMTTLRSTMAAQWMSQCIQYISKYIVQHSYYCRRLYIQPYNLIPMVYPLGWRFCLRFVRQNQPKSASNPQIFRCKIRNFGQGCHVCHTYVAVWLVKSVTCFSTYKFEFWNGNSNRSEMNS